MSVAFERGQNSTSRFNNNDTSRINSELQPPKGWSAATVSAIVAPKDEKAEEIALFVNKHLDMAAKRAERLISALDSRFGIEVPESYLRVRADGAFQVLLLVKHDDFVSPKIAGAKLLAEEYTHTELYDICFSFAVLSETVVNSVVLPYGYKLKHIQQHFDRKNGLTH